ncbi:MAG TPA: hypothetical protein VLW85_20495 [Myxococcales bacterium]|nr:hypothetical protein [Myxococcales bacterium]
MAVGSERFSRLAVPALHAALLFAFVPFGAQPFSRPKLLVLGCGACALAIAALLRPARAPHRDVERRHRRHAVGVTGPRT